MPGNESSPRGLAGRAPLVSIPLCTFNGAAYLCEQIESLLAQTHRNFEIVAVDDASSDRTVAILERYARLDGRMRFRVNASNIGHTRNFESALGACGGEFIAPCDQDDIWLPEKIAALLAHIGDHALAYCDSELIDDRGRSTGVRLSQVVNMLTTNDPAAFVFSNCVSGHASLFPRRLLSRALPVPDGFFYDWWLAAVAASRGGVIYCDRSLVRYRQHSATVTDILGARKVALSKAAKRDRRVQGYGEVEARIAALAALDGKHRAVLVRLRELWRARGRPWTWLWLGCFVAFRGRRLYAPVLSSDFRRLRKAMKLAKKLRADRGAAPHD